MNKQDKIIGSSSTTLPSISDFSSDKIDNDELSRLSEIDNLIKTSSPAQVIPAQVTPNTSNNSNVQPPLNNIQSTQPLNTTVPAQNINDTRTPLVNTDNSIVEVSETNIESLEIDNSVPININNSISLKLIDQNNNPIPNALAIIKDSKNNIIQAKVSDNLGLLLTNKEYSAGKYNVYIQSKEHKFPLLVFNIANKIYPIIIIKEI